MRVLFILSLFTALTAFAAFRGETSFRLRQHQWKDRLLLVFAPTAKDARFVRQQAEFSAGPEAFRDRDLLFLPVTPDRTPLIRNQRMDAPAQRALRTEFGIGPDAFAVLLIGKDGGVKLRQAEPVSAEALFRLIGSMPMRRQEMRDATSPDPNH